MNLGYACINTALKSNGIFTNRTMRRKTFDSKGLDYVLGSRMMGGGFGGCTINIVHSTHVDQFIEDTKGAYRKTYNKELSAIITTIDDGACIV